MANEENIVVRCPTCEQHVTGERHGGYRYVGDTPDKIIQVLLVGCPRCDGPFLLQRTGEELGEYGSISSQVDWEDRRIVLYPSGLQEVDPAVPKNIAHSYLGARRCFFDASEYTAAAIMCRRTLEGICKHFEAKGGNLKSKLADLKTRGVIEARLHEWADDVLRALGNDAAHDVDMTISKQDAQDALEFTKAIVEYLYVFEAAFKRFKERRAKATDGNATPAGFSAS